MASKSKDCKECGDKFIPSSRHLKCPACRSRRKKKHRCLDCTSMIRVDRVRCSSCSSRKKSGSGNGAWKGGRTYTKKGYVLILAPDHPRSGSGRYVFEHVLVMEEILGRAMLQEERVHHKNGVRDDNRPENLELWRGTQPSGARVVDLVEWAKELLRVYEPQSLK